MQTLGLSPRDFATYLDGLTRTHQRSVELTVTNLEGKHPVSLAPLMLPGSQITATRKDKTKARTLTLTFLDPTRALPFDSEWRDAPIHGRSQIRVNDARLIPELGRWVGCICFTGRIHDYDRDGAVVRLTAYGKETQALGARWKARKWSRGTRKTSIIRRLLLDTGERNLSIPNLSAKVAKRVVVLRDDKPGLVARRLAWSMGRQLWWDGRGKARLRRLPNKPILTFTPRWLLSDLRVDRDPDGVHNVFRVIGAKPRGHKRRVSATVWLPWEHPNSAQSLGRNGAPFVLPKVISDDQLRSRKACRRRAVQERNRAAAAAVSASFDTLPVPCLDEGDLVRATDGSQEVRVRADEWTLPLVDGPMTVGAAKRVGTKTDRRRVKPGAAAAGQLVSGEEI